MMFQVLFFLLCLHSNDIIPFSILFYTKVTLMLIFNHTASSKKKRKEKKKHLPPTQTNWFGSTPCSISLTNLTVLSLQVMVWFASVRYNGLVLSIGCYVTISAVRISWITTVHHQVYKKTILQCHQFIIMIFLHFFFNKKQQTRSVCLRCNLAYDMDKFLFKITLLNIL